MVSCNPLIHPFPSFDAAAGGMSHLMFDTPVLTEHTYGAVRVFYSDVRVQKRTVTGFTLAQVCICGNAPATIKQHAMRM